MSRNTYRYILRKRIRKRDKKLELYIIIFKSFNRDTNSVFKRYITIMPYFYLPLTDEIFSRLTEHITLDKLIELVNFWAKYGYFYEFTNNELKAHTRLIAYLIERKDFRF